MGFLRSARLSCCEKPTHEGIVELTLRLAGSMSEFGYLKKKYEQPVSLKQTKELKLYTGAIHDSLLSTVSSGGNLARIARRNLDQSS